MTRGQRNKNPFNIRRGENWIGMADKQTDKAFVQFQDVRFGIRAVFCILWTYRTKYGCKSIYDVIKRFAPPSENCTKDYAYAVAKESGSKITDSFYKHMYEHLRAMADIESDYNLTREEYERGFEDFYTIRSSEDFN